ncbi:hypothetical protein T265_11769 [Opisthorchis viverrini]|uniref:Uncharacterized protein n=1 Tax=Opisthorchis viverrini TaxID=6198 RepID=A0A074Z8A7_OPIVI|nr:hypothetical protein T265_11769 [Opisthorchis viverrini]KER19470.1 hypothetical protein T265_11769 [Opisthorchis viverrini]
MTLSHVSIRTSGSANLGRMQCVCTIQVDTCGPDHLRVDKDCLIFVSGHKDGRESLKHSTKYKFKYEDQQTNRHLLEWPACIIHGQPIFDSNFAPQITGYRRVYVTELTQIDADQDSTSGNTTLHTYRIADAFSHCVLIAGVKGDSTKLISTFRIQDIGCPLASDSRTGCFDVLSDILTPPN